jgi:hypothetical protein
VPDVSGHQLDATPVGRFVIEPAGVKGAAARFDGSTHLTVGSAVVPVQDVLHQEQFTLAVWVKPEAVAGRQPLIGKRYGETIVPFILSLFDGTVVFEAANVNHQYEYNFSSPRVMEAGVWQHLAVVVESGRSVALYRNGARIAGKAVGGRLCESDDPLVFGRDPWPGPGTDRKGPVFYQGLMDEAKFWARALTPAEVMAEHRAGGANGER